MMKQEYIKSRQQGSKNFKIQGIEVFVKNEISNNVSIRVAIEELSSIIPRGLMVNVNSIHVGNFEELNNRKIQALYKDSSIFITNKQRSQEDILDDLVHEVAHSVEEIREEEIYSDNKIKDEFLSKRKELWFRLKNEGFEKDIGEFLRVEYNSEFDLFLYKEVGYPLLSSVAASLFYSPYGATSIREYFANGFEAFFLREDLGRLNSTSPRLFKKIANLK
jgi:hypothetical protein